MPNFRKFLELIRDDEDGKVIKTIPMKKEWQEKWDKLEAATEELKQADKKKDSLKRIFWGTVEEDTGIYAQMRLNSKTNEIEVLED